MAVDAGTCEIPVGFFESIPLLDSGRFYKHIKVLTDTQKRFITLVNDWFRSPSNDIIVISGSPGSGKTFTVINTLFYLNADIIKMAYTGKVACNIDGSTIHSLLNMNWEEGSALDSIQTQIEELNVEDPDYISKCLNICKDFHTTLHCSQSANIIVIDEVGMIPFYLTVEIINYFNSKSDEPKLFILIGDKYQLKPVRCKYNIFNVPLLKYKLLELDDNNRFTPNYYDIIKNLKCLMKENNFDNFLNYLKSVYPILKDVFDYQLKECRRVLVYKNESAEKFNKFYLENLPGPEYTFPKILNNIIINKDWITLKKQCDIFINRKCEVPNGTFLKFVDYNKEKDLLICKYPNSNIFVNISRNTYSGQFPVTLGFASTIHKFQGETINDSNVLMQFDESEDMNLMYTALSRVRSMNQIMGIIL